MNEHTRRPIITDILIATAISLFALLVYGYTLTPSLSHSSPDGSELITIPYVLGLAHSPGYPLYTWIGKIFTLLPVGDVGYRMNLMSAVLGAMGVGVLYLIVMTMLDPKSASPTVRRLCAAIASLLFAFSVTFWSQAVIAEVYTPNILFFGFSLLALLHWERTRWDRDFFLFGLVYGLSLGFHLSNLGFAPAFALFILLTDFRSLKRPTWWMAGLGGFALGASQFLWLPYKAGTLVDGPMQNRSPITIEGFYNYTLGAFSQLKFAFPIGDLPERIVLYLSLLRNEFGFYGIFIGVIGLASLLLRRTRYYYLLIGMYLVHLWFFIQYRAFDLEVFFIPSHALWAIFIAFGAVEATAGLNAVINRIPRPALQKFTRMMLGAGMILLVLIPLLGNWTTNDHSRDVSINDFYTNTWELLPHGSVLITRGGVFGYEAFYWQMVYDTRSDVLIPLLHSSKPSMSDIQVDDLFSTVSLGDPRSQRGPWGLPPDLISKNMWQIPVLIGMPSGSSIRGRGEMTLYQISNEPPDLIIINPTPEISLDADLGAATLLGIDIHTDEVESGGHIHITLYWELEKPARFRVETSMGETVLEAHELGFGNLQRYQKEVGSLQGQVIVEDYRIVIPSTTSAKTHTFTIRNPESGAEISIGEITVTDEEETIERWLRIAGK
ncbi:MAG: DUF2723 domain-containing protein [Anaerolineales bacterium]|nr:DUF2723 domain-containing protein [Anaerolineales bacterium]